MAGQLNVGEHGQALRFGVKTNITGAVPTLILKKPDATIITKEVVDGVSIGTVDFTDDVSGITLLAGEYVLYITEVGLIDVVGNWQWRPEILFSGPVKLSKADFKPLVVRL